MRTGFIAGVGLLAMLSTGCAGLKAASRQPVDGASQPMVKSSFAPEANEGCSELGTTTCPYFNNPFKSVLDSCVEHVLPQADAANADYIFVDEPSVRVGGMNTSAPVAHWYRCPALAE